MNFAVIRPIALVLFCATAGNAAPVLYQLVDLGASYIAGNAINAAGRVVGTRADSEDSEAAINGAGQIAGTSYVGSTPYSTIWSKGTASAFGPGSYAQGINDAGQVTGMSAAGHAYLLTAGVMTDLGTLAGGGWSSGYAINNAGQVVGYGDTASGAFRGFVWSEGSGMQPLGTLGGSNSYAFAINDAGRIAGSAETPAGYLHAFRITNGSMEDLGTLGGSSSYGYGINSSGAVVGSSVTSGGGMHAFVFQDGVMTDLNALLTGASGWVLTAAYGINNAGQIAGAGLLNGVERAFRLDPVRAAPDRSVFSTRVDVASVPEPGSLTFILAGSALIAAGLFRRRR